MAVTTSRLFSRWSCLSLSQSVSSALSHWHDCISLASPVNQHPEADGPVCRWRRPAACERPQSYPHPDGKERRMETYNADDAMISTVCKHSHIWHALKEPEAFHWHCGVMEPCQASMYCSAARMCDGNYGTLHKIICPFG